MKRTFTFITILVSTFSFIVQTSKSQTATEIEKNLHGEKANFIRQQSYLSQNAIKPHWTSNEDSLVGFDEEGIRVNLLDRGLYGEELFGYINRLKRNYIDKKYGLVKPEQPLVSQQGSKTIGGIA